MEDKQSLIVELGYILHKRNLIEARRKRAKNKVFYYKDLKRVVDAFRGFTPELFKAEQAYKRHLNSPYSNEDKEEQVARLIHKINTETSRVAYLKKSNAKPERWLNNVSGLRKMILKYEAEYVKAKYDQARHTCATRKRVAFLTKKLGYSIVYSNGSVVNFGNSETIYSSKEFESMFREFEANRAIERMINGKQGKDKAKEQEAEQSSRPDDSTKE